MDSQSTLGADGRYYGQGGGGRPGPESMNSYREDIPLRDHPATPAGKDDTTDHVYDAPAAAPPQMMEEARPPKSGFGSFKAKKRIPWVVYTLTLIQVAVFIAEIAKNGMLFLTAPQDQC